MPKIENHDTLLKENIINTQLKKIPEICFNWVN